MNALQEHGVCLGMRAIVRVCARTKSSEMKHFFSLSFIILFLYFHVQVCLC